MQTAANSHVMSNKPKNHQVCFIDDDKTDFVNIVIELGVGTCSKQILIFFAIFELNDTHSLHVTDESTRHNNIL